MYIITDQKTEQASKTIPAQGDNETFPVIGIGASAGGLDPIREMLGHLPPTMGVSFVIIQHLASGQESLLPEILARSTKMKVFQVIDNLKLEQDAVYVIPPGSTMTLENGYLKLVPKVAAERPINAFFTSLALERKLFAIGVVLSGLGNDGTEGLKAIKAEGGITFAQAPKTAQYLDMPQNAIDAQAVDFVLSPERIIKELIRIAKHPQLIHAKAKTLELELSKEDTDLRKVLMILKTTFSIDFTHYKETTIKRRVTRRIIINKLENIREYVDLLRSNRKELNALFDDLLIGVTSFFREPKTFLVLKEKVLPQIAKNATGEMIRVWIPGCSTGEEVYSFAITLQEFLEENDLANMRVQIFGTDANKRSIEKARQGIYPKAIEDNVSDNRLKRFFTMINGSYQIIKTIREKCVFAKHDITSDPPFSGIDLIMCRNLLIYFDPHLQERVLPILYYGLKTEGFLILGESESVSKFQYLFEPIAPKGVIFKKKKAQLQPHINTGTFIPYTAKKAHNISQKTDALTSLKEEVDHQLIEDYTPATLLINSNLDIILFRGQVNPYLTHESGTASLNVNKIIKKEFRSQVQAAIFRSRKEQKKFGETIEFSDAGKSKTIDIEVKPFKTSQYEEAFFLLTFKETSCSTRQETSVNNPSRVEDTMDREMRELREDLYSTKQSLQTIVEAHEATTEELQSTIEEAQSSNEALQSTNEELETAKEELQSSNEELQTLNEELKNRNQSLSRINDDLENLIKNVDTTVIIVDNSFKIRRFTASGYEIFKITASNIGHAITDTSIGTLIKDLEKLLQDVAVKLTPIIKEVNGENDRCYELRIRPYLTSEKQVTGAVLTFVDITERKLLENERERHTQKLEEHVKKQDIKLIESERMAAIGQTAGMVGHDLRNPLQTVIGELYLAENSLKEMPESTQKSNIKESIDAISEQIKYMDKIISDLQTFVKPFEVHKGKIDLKKLLTDLLGQIDIPNNVDINVELREDLVIDADPQLIKRVLINLVTNAIQAMPDGGKIRIYAQRNEGQVQIRVADTGVGIPEDIKAKIFTPLFTTKPRGQGFGLAVCRRVIEALGGTIGFESQEGKGTTFTIKLPTT